MVIVNLNYGAFQTSDLASICWWLSIEYWLLVVKGITSLKELEKERVKGLCVCLDKLKRFFILKRNQRKILEKAKSKSKK